MQRPHLPTGWWLLSVGLIGVGLAMLIEALGESWIKVDRKVAWYVCTGGMCLIGVGIGLAFRRRKSATLVGLAVAPLLGWAILAILFWAFVICVAILH
jgi:hypothetical protein